MRARDIGVEVVEGWLCVGPDVDAVVDSGSDLSSPLLFGRLAQPVLVDDVTWGIDEDKDGRRILCVNLVKKAYPSGTGSGARIDCVFDESLHVNGEPCVEPGLSQGTITIQLPKDAIKPDVAEALRRADDVST